MSYKRHGRIHRNNQMELHFLGRPFHHVARGLLSMAEGLSPGAWVSLMVPREDSDPFEFTARIEADGAIVVPSESLSAPPSWRLFEELQRQGGDRVMLADEIEGRV